MYFNFARLNNLESSFDNGIGGQISLTISGDKIPDLTVEDGVHRFVRISPYDPLKRRHTNFCHVWTGGYAANTAPVARSYVFNPYKLAKNLINGKSTEDLDLVLSGRPDLLW